MAVGADDGKIREVSFACFSIFRQWEQVMHLCIACANFSIDACEVKAAACYFAYEAAALEEGIADLPLAKFSFALPMNDESTQDLAFQANQFVGTEVVLGPLSNVCT